MPTRTITIHQPTGHTSAGTANTHWHQHHRHTTTGGPGRLRQRDWVRRHTQPDIAEEAIEMGIDPCHVGGTDIDPTN